MTGPGKLLAISTVLVVSLLFATHAVTGTSAVGTALQDGEADALRTEVADLKRQSAALSTSVAQLETRITQVAPGSGTPSADSTSVVGVPNAQTWMGWQIQIIGVSTTQRIDASEYTYYDTEELYYLVSIQVHNLGSSSIEFPYMFFQMREQYGATYSCLTGVVDLDSQDPDRKLIPGNDYELLLIFEVAPEATGLLIETTLEPVTFELLEPSLGGSG